MLGHARGPPWDVCCPWCTRPCLPTPASRRCTTPSRPQFVAEFLTCEPLEQPSRPPSHLVSPWSLMEWQAGGGVGGGEAAPAPAHTHAPMHLHQHLASESS